MQRTMYPTGWEEPNDARDQAVNARGYFDGLQVKDGDVDWFQLKAGTWSTVHVDVQGDGVQASVMYANGTLLAPGPGGWWLEVPNPTEEFTLFAKVEGSGTYAITLDESRPEAP